MFEYGTPEYNRIASSSMEFTLDRWRRGNSGDFNRNDAVLGWAVFGLTGSDSRRAPEDRNWQAAWLDGIRLAATVMRNHERIHVQEQDG